MMDHCRVSHYFIQPIIVMLVCGQHQIQKYIQYKLGQRLRGVILSFKWRSKSAFDHPLFFLCVFNDKLLQINPMYYKYKAFYLAYLVAYLIYKYCCVEMKESNACTYITCEPPFSQCMQEVRYTDIRELKVYLHFRSSDRPDKINNIHAQYCPSSVRQPQQLHHLAWRSVSACHMFGSSRRLKMKVCFKDTRYLKKLLF